MASRGPYQPRTCWMGLQPIPSACTTRRTQRGMTRESHWMEGDYKHPPSISTRHKQRGHKMNSEKHPYWPRPKNSPHPADYIRRIPPFCKFDHKSFVCWGVESNFGGGAPEEYCRICICNRNYRENGNTHSFCKEDSDE